MIFATPHPLEDAAWRLDPDHPKRAHYFGVASDFDGRPKCRAEASHAGSRQVTEADPICSGCAGWYWLNISMPWLA